MGFFSGIGSFLGGPVGGAIGGLLDSHHKNRSVARAGSDQMAGYGAALDTSKGVMGDIKSYTSPYITNGGNASNSLATLLGLGGGGQGEAIESLKNSPLYQSLYHNGMDTVLQGASATGGLRGGNTENSLGHLGVDTLAQAYQSMIDNLSNVAGLGARTGLGAGGLENENARMQGGYDTGRGVAAANMVLGKNGGSNGQPGSLDGTMQNISQLFNSGSNPFASLFGGRFAKSGGAPF